MPSPINGLTGTNPARLILRFGQKPLPRIGTILPWIDLNDGVAWKLKDFKNEADRRIYLGQVHGRGRGFQIADDFYPRLITLTHFFDERSLQNFAAAKAAITQAGEQWLTFDNVTGISAKCQSMKAPTLMVPSPVTPFWESTSEFIAADPFARDLQPSGSIPNLLNPYGGAEPGTSTPTNWTGTTDAGAPTYTWTSVTVHSGAKALQIVGATGASGGWASPGGTSSYPVLSNTTYTLSAWMAPNGVGGTGAYLRPIEYNAAGGVVKDWGATLMAPILGGSGVWQQVTATFTTQPTTVFLGLRLQLAGTGTVTFDDVMLQQAFETTAGVYAQPFFDRINLPGAVNPGTATSFSIPYIGTVWTDQVLFQVNLPANSNVNSVKIANNTSGEVLTIIIPAPLTLAGYLQVDSNAFTVTDQAGTQYDMSGSFPMLYPGGPNAFTVTVQTSTGTVTATLDTRWTNRWEVQ